LAKRNYLDGEFGKELLLIGHHWHDPETSGKKQVNGDRMPTLPVQ
jgi:hypothetical protein